MMAEPSERPDILLVICHDLGRRLGCYGVPGLSTPAIDGMAAEGVLFGRYFATAPLCSPSRGCILTGCYPHTNGLMGLVNRGWDMPDRTPTLPQLVGAAGYETHLFGLHHEKRDPSRMGYGHIHTGEGARAASVLPEVAAFLRASAHPARRAPFLAVAALTEVHRPFKDARYTPDDPAAVAVPGYLPDHPAVREDLADLHGLVHAVDREMGGLLEAARACERAGARPLVTVFTCDHGIAFPRAKSTLYDAGIGTALILRGPGVLPPGVRCEALLSNVDLTPTLLEAAGVPPPPRMQGRSFWAAARGDRWVPREAIFAEKTYHDSYDPVRAVRTERWKYIRSWEPLPELVLPADIARSPSALAPAVVAATTRPRPPEELYDVLRDPDEAANLAADPSHTPVLAGMRGRLEAWMQDTADPLLDGRVPGQGSDA